MDGEVRGGDETAVDVECSPSVLITNLSRVKPFIRRAKPPERMKRKKPPQKTATGWQRDEEIKGNAVCPKFLPQI